MARLPRRPDGRSQICCAETWVSHAVMVNPPPRRAVGEALPFQLCHLEGKAHVLPGEEESHDELSSAPRLGGLWGRKVGGRAEDRGHLD